MLGALKEWMVPLRVIAKELTHIRKLYEAELMTKDVVLVTEEPNENDTEVFYSGEKERKTLEEKIKEIVYGESEDDDE